MNNDLFDAALDRVRERLSPMVGEVRYLVTLIFSDWVVFFLLFFFKQKDAMVNMDGQQSNCWSKLVIATLFYRLILILEVRGQLGECIL